MGFFAVRYPDTGSALIQLEDFAVLRPYLYHLTDSRNLPRVQRLGRLSPAADILHATGRPELITIRREADLVLAIDNDTVILRNQSPLHEANVELVGGWGFADLIGYLNAHVYFWPGDTIGPTGLGRAFLDRHATSSLAILRTRTVNLLAANRSQPALFSKYNSGAPRHSRGRPSPRGPDTFVRASQFAHTPSRAQEVAFHGVVALPQSTAHATGVGSPWQPLAGPNESGVLFARSGNREGCIACDV